MININSLEFRAIVSAWPDDPMMVYARRLKAAGRPLTAPYGWTNAAELPMPAGMTKADLMPRMGKVRLEVTKKC